jgi:NAD(P)-dependent dehydrogenase (short-subunit alcohol dehydrogenase family)
MSVTASYQVHDLKLLDGKVAVIYGAAGGVGTAVAKAFAREGATVFLAGRTENTLNPIAREISNAGGTADVSKVDALSSESVEAHLQKVVAKTGKLDVSFNLIGTGVAMGSKLTELSDQRFADAAFLGLTAPVARLPRPNMGGFSVQGAAIEALCRQLALEVGPRGVRVVCLRTGGTPDNPVLQAVFTHLAKLRGTTFQAIADSEAQNTALKRAPLLPEVANAAVLIASDYASAITATTVNASSGELVD